MLYIWKTHCYDKNIEAKNMVGRKTSNFRMFIISGKKGQRMGSIEIVRGLPLYL